MIFTRIFTETLLEIVLTLISAYVVLKSFKTRKISFMSKVYYNFSVANFLFVFFNFLSILHRHRICFDSIVSGYIIYFFLLTTLSIASCSWFVYVVSAIGLKAADSKKKIMLWSIPVMFYAVLCLASCFTGWIFAMDAEGQYYRGPLWGMQYVFCFSYCVVAMVFSAVNYFHDKARKNIDRILFLTMVVDLVAVIIQIIIQENLMAVALTFTVLLSYINVFAAEKQLYEEAFERERQSIVKQFEEQQLIKENNARLFALEDNFESLYDVELESGKYTVYVKGDFYQNNVLDKLLQPYNYFEDLAKNVETVIYEEDRSALIDVMTPESIQKNLALNEHFDYFYRINTTDGPDWFKLRAVYKNKEKKSVIIGVFKAAEEVAIKQKNDRLIEAFANENEVSLLFDLQANTFTLLSNNGVATDIVTDLISHEKSNIRYAEKFVHPDDRYLFDNDIYTPQGARTKLPIGETSSFEYRSRLFGKDVWYRAEFTRIAENEVIIGYRNCDEEILSRHLSDKVIADFASVFVVNLKDDTYRFVSRNSESGFADVTGGVYSETIREYASRVNPAYRESWYKVCDVASVRQMLTENSRLEYVYPLEGVEKRWRRCIIQVLESENGVPTKFIMTYFVLDDKAAENLELEAKVAESEKLIESVAASYDVAYAVNMKDDSFRLLKNVGELLEHDVVFENYSESKEAFLSIIHNADKDFMRNELEYETIRKKLQEKVSYNVEYRVEIDGSTQWHEMNVTRIDDDNVALGFAEKDVELTKLHLEEKRYDEYFALFVLDFDTGMLKIAKNEGGYDKVPVGVSTPYTPFIQGLADMLDDEPKAFFNKMADLDYARKEFISNDKLTYSYKVDYLSNGKVWIDITSYIILRHDDGTPAMCTIGFSVADTLASARLDAQKDLAEARIAAEEANKSKTDFLFNMSHDIRTPMNAITGFTNMAIKHIEDSDKVLDYLYKIQKAGSMLLSLINSVLEVSRIESGHATLEEQYGDVYYSFSNIENTMHELADTKDIYLSFGFGEIRNRYVYADFTRCMRIFVNVISNAIKYTPDGGTVKVTCEQLGEPSDGKVTFRYVISDNGIGMSEEFQKHVFDQFSRENTATVSGIQGTGLGMTVVKSFVDLLGGTIGLESRQGEGTTFTIDLPFRIQEGKSYTDPETGNVVTPGVVAEKPAAAYFEGKNVLLVDDNDFNREIALEILEDAGVSVETANDGTVAVEMMKAKGSDYYDFILMDIQMPKMNGYEATKAIRAMYPDSAIPIIALSANAFSEDREKSLSAGMDDHVAKPINVDELFKVISKFV